MTELSDLIDDTDLQLQAAFEAVGSGNLVDLTDLVPRIDRVCALAVEQRATDTAPRLASLIERLDELGRQVRDRMGGTTPDPRRAAALYKAAAPPDDETE